MEELLTVYDDYLHILGTATRTQAHAQGLWHQVVHCWVVGFEEKEPMLYFQQRSFDKADFPGLYDLAVGGHIADGEEMLVALTREMGEEIGLHASPEELEYLGYTLEEIHIGDFFDREIGQVYLYRTLAPSFAVGEEVERMIKVPLSMYLKKELEGASVITAYTLDNRPIEIEEDSWCKHPQEFEKLVLPKLMGR